MCINGLDPNYSKDERCGNCHWGHFWDKKTQQGSCVKTHPVFLDGEWRRPVIGKNDWSCGNYMQNKR